MSQNTTDFSEIENCDEDVHELIIKVNNLSSQNEILGKKLREQDHNFTSKLEEYIIENNKLKSTNYSIEELLKSYKNQSMIKDVSSSHNFEIELIDFKSKFTLLEQNEQNLKRKNMTLNREISDLKIKIDSLLLGFGSGEQKEMKLNDDFYDLDKLDEEKKLLIKEVLIDYEELKKQNLDLTENALNMIADKEMTNMELRETIDQLKEKYNSEINKLRNEVHEYKRKCLNSNILNDNDDDDDKISLNSEEEEELIENYSKLTEDYEKIRKKIEEKEIEMEKQKIKFKQSKEKLKSINKELQDQILKYTTDISNYEYENSLLGKVASQDSHSKSLLVKELDKFQQKIANLEEIKEKNENDLKEHIIQLNEELSDLNLINNDLKYKNTCIEKEFNEFKFSNNRKIKEALEKTKIEIINKEKELLEYKCKLDDLEIEREYFKNDCENSKKYSEKLKLDFSNLRDQLKKIKEEHETEKRIMEGRLISHEKKYETEKKNLSDLIMSLQYKLTSLEAMKKEMIKTVESAPNAVQNIDTETETKTISPIKNTLEDVLDEDDLSNKLSELKNEIDELKIKNIEYQLKISCLKKEHGEIESIKNENLKLINNIKELSELYENQLEELQQKNILANAELNFTRKKLKSDGNMIKLNAEIKFLNEKIIIMANEINQMKVLNEKNLNFLKNEITLAEQTAVSSKVELASLAYEKDCEIIKHKNAYKKLKTKVETALNVNKTSQIKKK